MQRFPSWLLAGFSCAFVASSLQATVIPIVTSGTYEAGSDGTKSAGSSSSGVNYNRVGTKAVGGVFISDDLPFALPTIPAGESITGATLSISTVAQSANKPSADIDLYGANAVTAAAPVATAEPYYYSGTPSDGSSTVTSLQANFVDPTTGATSANFTSNDISSFIEGLYTAGATPGQFVTLRLSYDSTSNTTSLNRFEIYKSGTLAGAANATLTITTAPTPEPASLSMIALGAMGLLGRRRK